MQRILTANQDKLLRRERQLLEELRVILARLEAPEDDLDLLKRCLSQFSPTTRPDALRLVEGGARVRVECETPWGRQVVDLDASTLQELPPAGS